MLNSFCSPRESAVHGCYWDEAGFTCLHALISCVDRPLGTSGDPRMWHCPSIIAKDRSGSSAPENVVAVGPALRV